MSFHAAPAISLARPEHTTLTRATADAIHKAILDGVFPHGSQLPTEAELMEMLGVSRTTLREALKSLEELDLIKRRRGLGTFVTEKSIHKDLSQNFGITTMISQAGLKPGTMAQEVRREIATGAIQKALELEKGGEVIVVDRVRTANDRPAVWTQDYIPAENVDSVRLEANIVGGESIYSVLHELFQINIVHGVAHIAPIAANAMAAEKLEIKRGTPMLLITQTDYLANDEPILYSVEVHLPDMFVFTIHRKGPQR
jgi:DNA-binding GntR family transcriptional regulator